MWIERCQDLQTEIAANSFTSGLFSTNKDMEGWCLKKPKKVVRFSIEVKEFLYSIYAEGEQTGKRPSYEDISDQLKKERNNDGTKKFKANDWLTSGQIRSLFGSFTLKKTNTQKSGKLSEAQLLEVDFIDDQELCSVLECMQCNERNAQIQTLSAEILETV